MRYEKERKLFIENFDLLNAEKTKFAYQNSTNREILAER